MYLNLLLHIKELTILTKLSVAFITHFGSLVLHVFQGNFVSATVSAHNLWPIICKENVHLSNYIIEACVYFCEYYYLATGMTVMPSVSEAEMDRAVHTHCYLGNGNQRRCILPETHHWLLPNLKKKTAIRNLVSVHVISLICGTFLLVIRSWKHFWTLSFVHLVLGEIVSISDGFANHYCNKFFIQILEMPATSNQPRDHIILISARIPWECVFFCVCFNNLAWSKKWKMFSLMQKNLHLSHHIFTSYLPISMWIIITIYI